MALFSSSERELELARTRCRRATGCGTFAVLATLVLLGLLLFGKSLLDEIGGDPSVVLLTGATWLIIIAAWFAAGNGFFGLRGLPTAPEKAALPVNTKALGQGRLGCGLALLPFVLLAAYYLTQGQRKPAPGPVSALKAVGAELATSLGSPSTGEFANSSDWLAAASGKINANTNQQWYVVEGLKAKNPPDTPFLFSPNLRSATYLNKLAGPVRDSMNPQHPLGTRWLVVVTKNGQARMVDTEKTTWEELVRPEHRLHTGRILSPVASSE